MDSSHLGGYPSQPLDSLSGAKLDQQIRDSSEDMMGCDIIHELGSIGQRRQALERGLLTRRDPTILQQQGILPPPKTPATHFYESKCLARRKTEDYLKNKIAQRPDRKTLIEYHILEDNNVSPSLANSQKNLQRAQLQDQLNLKIGTRPGPIELIQRNILPVDESIKQKIHDNYFTEPRFDSPGYSPGNSPPGQTLSFDSSGDFDFNQSSRPSSRIGDTRCSRKQVQKMHKRSKFKFHVYSPAENKTKKESIQSTTQESYEDRLRQQQLLLEMDNLQHHIEQSKPKDNLESMLQQNFGKNERSPLILPAPQAIGDQLMREIQQRNKIMRPTPHQSPNVRATFHVVNAKLVPPPPHNQVPPSPPPLIDSLRPKDQNIFDPARRNEYKVKELKNFCRKNGLSVSGSKDALVERLMSYSGMNKANSSPKQSEMQKKMREMQETIKRQEEMIMNLQSGTSSRLPVVSSVNSSSMDICTSLPSSAPVSFADVHHLPTPTHAIAMKQFFDSRPPAGSESSMFGLQPFNLKHEPSLTNMSSASSLPQGSVHQSANHQETPSMEFDKLLFQTQFTPDNTTKSSNHNPVSIAETINSNARYCNLNSVSNMNVPVSSSHFQSNPLETLDSAHPNSLKSDELDWLNLDSRPDFQYEPLTNDLMQPDSDLFSAIS